MKKKLVFLMVSLCLIISYSSSIIKANSIPEINKSEYCWGGGLVVIAQGLTESPIEVVYPTMRVGMNITATIVSENGETLYHVSTKNPILDFSSMNFPEGKKSIVIKVGTEFRIIAFE